MVVLTGLVLAGLRRTIVVNVVLLTVTVVAIVGFGIAGLTQSGQPSPIDKQAIRLGLLPAITFLFVAYTGYGRIATLGEEVRRPAVNIPRAVMVTLVVAVCLYGLVAIGGRAIGGEVLGGRGPRTARHWSISCRTATDSGPHRRSTLQCWAPFST